MKKILNINIHDGLHQSEIRNFLSIQLMNAETRNATYRKNYVPQGHPYDTLIYSAKEDIKELQNRIEYYETLKGIAALIKVMGWEEFDVSRETIPSDRKWMSFIGTQNEYDQLINGD